MKLNIMRLACKAIYHTTNVTAAAVTKAGTALTSAKEKIKEHSNIEISDLLKRHNIDPGNDPVETLVDQMIKEEKKEKKKKDAKHAEAMAIFSIVSKLKTWGWPPSGLPKDVEEVEEKLK